MESDQLEEYRRMAQSRHMQRASRKDAALARQMQEEENKRIKELAERDAEIANKLQAQYSVDPQAYSSAQQAAAQPYGQAYAPAQPYSSYQSYPPPRQPQAYYQAPPPAQGAQQPLLQPQTRGVLPAVTDKCCGVNTQVCVLTTAGVLTAGIIVTFVLLLV